MKKKTIIGLCCSLLGLGVTTTSCEDMLTPEMDRYAEGFSGRDTVNFYFGILQNLQDVAENNILLGDIRSDLADTTGYVSDTVATLANFDKVADGENGLLSRAAYYKVINQCNYYLAAVDTTAQKNNIYYMRREFAQVQMVRAWIYMQLVQNYGEVPFITSPVTNAHTGWETNPEGGFATADNLLDLLLKNGLQQAYEYEKVYGTPNYGTLNNGNANIPASLCVFPADVVMGDLYLLRGKTKADYEKAASYYYTFIDEQNQLSGRNAQGMVSVSKSGQAPNERYSSNPLMWATFLDQGASPSTASELVTIVPSAANSSMGTVLTRAARVYGFDPSSSTSSTTTTDEDGKPVYNTTGVITVTANYKSRQLAASRRYTNLSSSQLYCVPKTASGAELNNVGSSAREQEIASVEYWPCGDGRLPGTVRSVRTTAGNFDFVQKRATSMSYSYMNGTLQPQSSSAFYFNYTLPLYRVRQIYLRYAEAINRAGYPRYAYAVLRDGLTPKSVPTLTRDTLTLPDNQGRQVVYYRVRPANGADITVDEVRRAQNVNWLTFDEARWETNVGIHRNGCSIGYDLDTLYCYNVTVAQRIADEKARTQGLSTEETAKLANTLQTGLVAESKASDAPETGGDGTGDGTDSQADGDTGNGSSSDALPAADPKLPENIADQINAVETLIADEMALETAFEGFRYYDLFRIARHKNNDVWGGLTSDYGTNWFAWTVARRSVNAAPYAQPSTFNAALYSKLQDQSNWFLQNPQY